MKNYLLTGALLLSVFFLGSCRKHFIKGEGPIETEIRSVSDFSEIVADGSIDVTVVKDNEYKVVLTGYGNLIPIFETKVNGDRLTLQYENRYHNVRNDNLEIEVHTPYVEKLVLNGSGDAVITSGFVQEKIEGKINGSGNISVNNCEVTTLTADINGSGTFKSTSTEADNVFTYISGSGDIYVHVNEFLKVRSSGSGDVWYSGDPDITDIDISGSGDVHKKN